VKPLLALFTIIAAAAAEPARIHVFVALADNKNQGIAPVPAKIGNGEDAARNLYWGASEALPPLLRASAEWKLASKAAGPKASILERLTFSHKSGRWELVADAYRGADIRECTGDFFTALASDEPLERFPLAAYIGHDGLMEFAPPPESVAKRGPGRAAIVLCCMSRQFFVPHLTAVNAKPLLLTTQLMYPGGFILRDALTGWTRGENASQVRQRAASAYARNQGISVRAAAGVFATGE
jgi:hypothetical protein